MNRISKFIVTFVPLALSGKTVVNSRSRVTRGLKEAILVKSDTIIIYGLIFALLCVILMILSGVTMLGKALKVTAFGLCAILPLSSYANNFNYNTLEVRMGTSPGTFGGEITSYFTENTHFIGRADSEFSGDWDVAGGIGFNGPAGQFADIYGQMLLHNIKKNSSDKVGDEWHAEVNVGTRVWLMQNVEFHARLGQLMDNDDSHTVYNLGARFHSTQQLSLGADFKNNGVYGQQLVMSARFGF